MKVRRCGHAQTTLQRAADVRDDVAEQIVGDDDIELTWVLDQHHRQCIDIEVTR